MKINAIRKAREIGDSFVRVTTSMLFWGMSYILLFYGLMPDQRETELRNGLILLVFTGISALKIDPRNRKSLRFFGITIPAIPLGLYAANIYRADYKILLCICTSVAFAVSAAITAYLFLRPTRNLKQSDIVLASRIFRCIYRVVSVFASVLIVFMVITFVHSGRLEQVLGISFEKTTEQSEVSASTDYGDEEGEKVVLSIT